MDVTKEITVVQLSGLSYFFRAVVTVVILLSSVTAEDVAVVETTTAVSGLSFSYSAADATEICGKKNKNTYQNGIIAIPFYFTHSQILYC